MHSQTLHQNALASSEDTKWSTLENFYSGLGGKDHPVRLNMHHEMNISTQELQPSIKPKFDKIAELFTQIFDPHYNFTTQVLLNAGEHYLSISVYQKYNTRLSREENLICRMFFGIGREALLTYDFANPFFPTSFRDTQNGYSKNFTYDEAINFLTQYKNFVETQTFETRPSLPFGSAYELYHRFNPSTDRTDEQIIEYIKAVLQIKSYDYIYLFKQNYSLELLDSVKDAPKEWADIMLGVAPE